MSMGKRGSRLITVDGVLYRWSVRRSAQFEAPGPTSTLTVIVESTADLRHPLKVVVPPLPTDDWLHGPGHVVMPKQVAAWIRRACVEGWQSNHRGGVHHLRVTLEEIAHESGTVDP